VIEPFTVPFMARALTGMALLALICGPVGVLVFARRLSFVSDALTHTVFPGVVIGFLAGGPDGLFAGALVAAVVTAVALTLLTRGGALTDDAATAVVLTAMFSIGVALVSRRSSYTSDLTSFLFGRLLTVTPRQIAETAVLAVVILAVLAVLARPLLGLVYGDDFRDAAESLLLLLPGAVLFAGSSILGAGILAAGRPFTATLTQVLGMVVTIAGLFIFLRSGGITAAALVSTAAYGTVFAVALALYRRTIGAPWSALLHPSRLPRKT